jgi:hypothetical protein
MRSKRALAFSTLLSLTACGGSSAAGSIPASGAGASSELSVSADLTPASARAQRDSIYVVNRDLSVFVLPIGSSGNVMPKRIIPGPPNPPPPFGPRSGKGIAVDVHGNVYVPGATDVSVYGPSSNVPLRTIDVPNSPFGVAVDDAGTLYVTAVNATQTGATIGYVYGYDASASGQATPVFTITGPDTGLTAPPNFDEVDLGFVAVDAQHNIYVENALDSQRRPMNPGVFAFPAGSDGNTPGPLVVPDVYSVDPTGFAINRDGSKLYFVADSAQVAVFTRRRKNGEYKLIRQLGSASSGKAYHAVALDAAGKVYALQGGTIDVYAAHAQDGASPIRSLTGSFDATDVAIGP